MPVNLNAMRLGVALAAVLTVGPVNAAAVGAFGTFIRDDDVQVLSFTTTGSGLVRIETFGYAGGTDATGRVLASGGFDPVFAVFSSSGALLGYGDDGASRVDPGGAAFQGSRAEFRRTGLDCAGRCRRRSTSQALTPDIVASLDKAARLQ
jgi:hypothetical protein